LGHHILLHCSEVCDNPNIVTKAVQLNRWKQCRVAGEIILKEEECSEDAKHLGLTGVHVLYWVRSQTQSPPEWLIILGNNPGKATLAVFLHRCITDNQEVLLVAKCFVEGVG